MPQSQYNKEQNKVASANPHVLLPTEYSQYQAVASDKIAFRKWLDEMIVCYPELFPVEIGGGYRLLGASLALAADEAALTSAYGYFRDEAHIALAT